MTPDDDSEPFGTSDILEAIYGEKFLGPCSTHATINCLQCYDIDLEDLDENGSLKD